MHMSTLKRHKRRRVIFQSFLLLLLIALVSFSIWKWWSLIWKIDLDSEEEVDTPPDAFCLRRRPTLVCAHGGDTTAQQHPPSTRESFLSAINLGVACQEVDVARTLDGVLTVLHRRDLKALLELPLNQGVVKALKVRGVQLEGVQAGDLFLAEISQLRWLGGESILSVRDAILLSQGYVETIILDIKLHSKKGQSDDEGLIVDALTMLVHDLSCDNCLIWAKEDSVIKRLKTLSPGQRVGYIVVNESEAHRRDGMHLPLRMSEPEVVGMHWAMTNEYHLGIVHDANKHLYSWTINNREDMRRVLWIGVDALVTNDPKMAIDMMTMMMNKCEKGGEL